MQVVILAAGTGSRLKDKTTSIPKALIPVAGRPLLAYSLRFAQMAGGEEIIVVVGCFAEKVVALLNELKLPNVRWVENRDYLKGNLYSLGAARGDQQHAEIRSQRVGDVQLDVQVGDHHRLRDRHLRE